MGQRKPKLLLVEDDPPLLQTYRTIFSAYEHLLEIVLAVNAAETLQALEASGDERPRAMVLDLMMPYGEARDLLNGQQDPDEVDTGVQLLEYVRRHEQQNGTRPVWVAVVTARSAYAVETKVMELLGGLGKLFLKPFDTLALEDVVVRAIGLESHLPSDLLVPTDDEETR